MLCQAYHSMKLHFLKAVQCCSQAFDYAISLSLALSSITHHAQVKPSKIAAQASTPSGAQSLNLILAGSTSMNSSPSLLLTTSMLSMALWRIFASCCLYCTGTQHSFQIAIAYWAYRQGTNALQDSSRLHDLMHRLAFLFLVKRVCAGSLASQVTNVSGSLLPVQASHGGI